MSVAGEIAPEQPPDLLADGAAEGELAEEVLGEIRRTVRALLERNPSYAHVSPALRRGLAQALVTVCSRGVGLIAEERRLDAEIATRTLAAGAGPSKTREADEADATGEIETRETSRDRAPRLATAQSAGDQLGLQAARNAGATIDALKKAIDFPQFVQSLISGTFEAIVGSNMHQLEAIGDLLDNVSAATNDFTEANINDGVATAWALQKFPFLTSGPDGLAVRPGVDLSEQAGALRAALGPDGESVDASDLAGTLLPLVKKKVGQSRQQMLGTMVQMGLQRIVVDQGQLHASMDMRVDTSSISTENKGEQSHFDLSTGASGSFGVGAWGASAYVNTSIGKVESDQQYTQEQLASRAGLRSSVDIAFRTEQIPLDRMADEKARVKLNLAARVPVDVDSGSSLLQSAPGPTPAPAPPPPGVGASPAPAAPRPAAGAPGAAAPHPPTGGAPAASGTHSPSPAPGTVTPPGAPAPSSGASGGGGGAGGAGGVGAAGGSAVAGAIAGAGAA